MNNAEDCASTYSFLKSDITTDNRILFVQSDTPPKKFITINNGIERTYIQEIKLAVQKMLKTATILAPYLLPYLSSILPNILDPET